MHARNEFDLVVVGSETEGCLSAIAAAQAGTRTALLHPPGHFLGGLITQGGLAFVDRDSRHEFVPGGANADGIFGRFLQRAGVQLVAMGPEQGHTTLTAMLAEAGVTVLEGSLAAVEVKGDRLVAMKLHAGESLTARHWLDATPDGDLAAAAGVRFTDGFKEYGVEGYLGISPLPLMAGVSAETIGATCERLAADPELQALKRRIFAERRFLDLDVGVDYVLVGPPDLGLAYQRWRESAGLPFPYPFQADGFNVAMVGPEVSSWNGLIYFADGLATMLPLSRNGADALMQREAELFVRFCREGLGWEHARLARPNGMYVRQTRHALGTAHRLTLNDIVSGYAASSVGTFAYYADFRGFSTTPIPRPLTAHVIRDAGLFPAMRNLAIASRAGGYTPFAHSLCRLVQYNATLGSALGITAAFADSDLAAVPVAEVRQEMIRQGILADDPAGLVENAIGRPILATDSLFAREGGSALA